MRYIKSQTSVKLCYIPWADLLNGAEEIFEHVTGVLFLVDLAVLDSTDSQGLNCNSLTTVLNLFNSIVNRPSLAHSPISLLLHNTDRFFANGHPLSDADAVLDRFKGLSQPNQRIERHFLGNIYNMHTSVLLVIAHMVNKMESKEP